MVTIDSITINPTILAIVGSAVICIAITIGIFLCSRIYRKRRKRLAEAKRRIATAGGVEIVGDEEGGQSHFALEDFDDFDDLGKEAKEMYDVPVGGDPFEDGDKASPLVPGQVKDPRHED
jgi:hypothetical protein